MRTKLSLVAVMKFPVPLRMAICCMTGRKYRRAQCLLVDSSLWTAMTVRLRRLSVSMLKCRRSAKKRIETLSLPRLPD